MSAAELKLIKLKNNRIVKKFFNKKKNTMLVIVLHPILYFHFVVGI